MHIYAKTTNTEHTFEFKKMMSCIVHDCKLHLYEYRLLDSLVVECWLNTASSIA